ncbi:MAG: insulinase family protein [Xanthomonadales bacterium]|nr:insulinase family protein [Xanthomonadales bacterium]
MNIVNRTLSLTVALVGLAVSTTAQAVNLTELPLENANKVVFKVRFSNGSISDPEGLEGLTYATATMMAQGGAGGMSYAQIQDRLYPWAASYDVLVDKQVTTFTFQVPTDFVDEFYPIMRAIVLKPNFDERDFSRIRSQQQNYVDQVVRASSDEDYSKFALENQLFRGGNMAHLVQGRSASVYSISLDDVKAHYARAFNRHLVSAGLAGRYDAALKSRFLEDLAQLPDSEFRPPEPSLPRQPEGVEVEIISKQGAFGSAIFTGAPLAITRADDSFAALMIANSWMGEHRKSYSRLYQKLRETRSMNYGDYSYIEWYHAGGQYQLPPSGVPRSSNYWSIWIRPVQIASQLREQYEELSHVEIGHAHFALRLALREFKLLIERGMSEEDFEATRTFLRSYSKLWAQSPAQQLGWLMDSKFYGRSDWLAELDSLLAKVTLEEVNAAIRLHWQTDKKFVTIVTDSSEARPLAASLISNKPSSMSYSNLVREGLPHAVLQEDAAVATYPINVRRVTIIDSKDMFR